VGYRRLSDCQKNRDFRHLYANFDSLHRHHPSIRHLPSASLKALKNKHFREIQLADRPLPSGAAEPKVGTNWGYCRPRNSRYPNSIPTMPPYLTETAVKAVKPTEKARKIYDERGLFLFVPPRARACGG
jgi:hypothetical protein